MPTTPRTPNRLAREKSPYLLQHAHNPVDWYPWGEEAFARARAEDRPIFLSIGYSTCHWCHVMERESFEDDEVAGLLNAHFVPVKVDREERPDVDRIHMTAMQALGAGGGWPLNVFLTPALEPFFGGTYYPPRTRGGRIGMTDLLARVHAAWLAQRAEIAAQGARVLEALATLAAPEAGPTERATLIEEAFQSLELRHDPNHGGFGGAPKFPSTVNLDFLLRVWWDDPGRRPEALAMVRGQLDAMRAGGLQDHLGGGFHRYSTDREWLVPHFEKMLYDQALLAWAYLEGFQATGAARYAATARGILEYVARDLSSPEGAFLSAEDADAEGEEGRFHVWTPEQVGAVLEPADAALFGEVYGLTEQGNFEHRNTVLHEARPVAEVAHEQALTPEQAEARLAAARAALFAARERRVRPHRDDKVITAWNGLMISAFARGARVLGDAALLERATRAAEFVWARLRDSASGALWRRWRDGEVAGAGQLDDHAYLAHACLDLSMAGHDPVWLERAVELTESMIARFADPHDGGFFETPEGDPSLRVRMKDDFDGAEMAGNSIAAWLLQALGVALGRDDWRARARAALDAYARRLRRAPVAMPRMLVAMQLERAVPRQLVVVGQRGAADTLALAREADRRFLPHDLLLVVDPAAPGPLARLAPFAAALPMRDGRATAYVCVDHACRLPVTDPAAFGARLDERPARRPRPGGGPMTRAARTAARALLAAALLAALVPPARAQLGAGAGAPPPERILTAGAAPVTIAAGGTATAEVRLALLPEWHANGNPPSPDYMIPTEVSIAGAAGVRAGAPRYPAAEPMQVEFETEPVMVYSGTVTVRVPLTAAAQAVNGTHALQGAVRFQACNDKVCMPPATVPFTLAVTVTGGAAAPAGGTATPPAGGAAAQGGERAPPPGDIVSPGDGAPAPVTTPPDAGPAGGAPGAGGRMTAPPADAAGAAVGGDAGARLAGALEKGALWWFLALFIGGLALNLTPCVFPMLGVTVSVFGARQKQPPLKVLGHAVAYVLGICVTYSVLGVVAALTGGLFGAALQNMWVSVGLGALFLALSLSMFGLYEMNPPAWLLARLGGADATSLAGIFVSGLAVGIIAAPCVGPFVVAVLALIAQRGEALFGFQTMFVLSLGLGFPYLFLALFSNLIQALPRSGDWMEWVKKVFGVLLAGIGLTYVLVGLAPAYAPWVLPLALLLGGSYLGFVDRHGSQKPAFHTLKAALGVLAVAGGIASVLVLRAEGIRFRPYEEAAVQAALAAGRPVMLEFSATWCAPCHELDRHTFTDGRVIAASRRFEVFKVDLTRYDSPEAQALRRRFGVTGVPEIVFLRPDGTELRHLRVLGFIPPDPFLRVLEAAHAG